MSAAKLDDDRDAGTPPPRGAPSGQFAATRSMRPGLDLDDGQMADLRSLLYKRTGLSFDENRNDYLRARVGARMSATVGEEKFASYFSLLQSVMNPGELQKLVNLVTVNETHFFRETYQLDCLVNSLLDEIVAKSPHKRHLKIWSLPCSTGEEPYTIAMYLLERWPRADAFEIQIVGSDIDTTALEVARRGRYHERSVRVVPDLYLKKYFRQVGSEFVISEDLRGSVELTHVNVSDPRAMSVHRDVDVVFCRNLLIYFDEESRRVATDNIFQSLAPGGFVCLGHSESMTRMSDRFELRKLPEAIVYQKPLARAGAGR